jgi:heme-degrading monooxygenase HmoA
VPIQMTAVVPGLDAAHYDQIVAAVKPTMQSSAGFRSHFAYDGDGGWTVVELWESEAEWRAFFDANVKDHLPPDATQTLTELHNVVLP